MPAEAEDDELLDEYDDDDESDEGIYEDEEDIFDSEGKVDHDNPVITREQEQAQVYDIKNGKEKAGGGLVKRGKRRLVARFDNRERPFVAIFEERDGKPVQVSKWRAPTAAEAKKLDTKGRVVRGGVIDDDDEDDAIDLGEAEEKKLPTWLKVGAGVLAIGAVAAGGYYIYKNHKSDDDAEVDEVDD